MSGSSIDIAPVRARPEDVRPFAQLLEISMGRPLERMWGGRGPVLVEQLFRVAGSTMSADVSWFAKVEGEVVGLVIAFPGAEFEARARETWRLEQSILDPAPLRRRRLQRAWRRLRRAPFGPVGTDSFYLASLAVAPGARRQGVARALFDHVCRQGSDADHDGVSLDVASYNREALRFYESVGCRLTRRHGQLLKFRFPLSRAKPTDQAKPTHQAQHAESCP